MKDESQTILCPLQIGRTDFSAKRSGLVPQGLGLGPGEDIGAEALQFLAGTAVDQLVVSPGRGRKFNHIVYCLACEIASLAFSIRRLSVSVTCLAISASPPASIMSVRA